MCDRADAILLGKRLQSNPPTDLHTFLTQLTSTTKKSLKRYTAYEADSLDYFSQDLLASSIWNAMNSSGTGLW